MIDNMELLRIVMAHNPGKSPDQILEQYAVYKAGLAAIDAKFAAGPLTAGDLEAITAAAAGTAAPAKPEKVSPTAGYSRRNLKVKPADAIQDDKIFCCICGKESLTLTERHLASHNGLTREGYIKLCGYEANQPLMAKKHLERMKANVIKAQQARKAKMKSAAKREKKGKGE